MTTAELAESAMKDALTHLFSEDRDGESIISDSEQQQQQEQPPQPVDIENVEREDILVETAGASTEQEISGLPATIATKPDNGKPRVSRAELIQIMEGFVELVKNSDESDFGANELSFAPPKIEVKDVVTVADKTAEVAELRTLLVEAQGTIIRLLTDRVDDRARLASLQNEIRLLPDLKAQSERAMAIAFTADEFKAEFAKVKLEIERMKLTKLRTEVDAKNRPWWIRFTNWMKKKETAGE
jgi:hypothetical protein